MKELADTPGGGQREGGASSTGGGTGFVAGAGGSSFLPVAGAAPGAGASRATSAPTLDHIAHRLCIERESSQIYTN